jgi:hypothetical protein
VGDQGKAGLVGGEVQADDARVAEAGSEPGRGEAVLGGEVTQRAEDHAGFDPGSRHVRADRVGHCADHVVRREFLAPVDQRSEADLGVEDVVAVELREQVVDGDAQVVAGLQQVEARVV